MRIVPQKGQPFGGKDICTDLFSVTAVSGLVAVAAARQNEKQGQYIADARTAVTAATEKEQ